MNDVVKIIRVFFLSRFTCRLFNLMDLLSSDGRFKFYDLTFILDSLQIVDIILFVILNELPFKKARICLHFRREYDASNCYFRGLTW